MPRMLRDKKHISWANDSLPIGSIGEPRISFKIGDLDANCMVKLIAEVIFGEPPAIALGPSGGER